MKKLAVITITALITLTLLSQAVDASFGKDKENDIKDHKSEVKIQIKTENNKIKKEIEIEQDEEDDKNKIKFLEKKGNEFKIWGPIQSFTAASLTIDGKTITIDPNETAKFKQVGIIKVGMFAKVEGVIINNVYYAKKIIINQRNKKEVSGTPSVSPTASATGTITPAASLAVSPTLSISPRVTSTVSPTLTTTLSLTKSEAFKLDKLIKSLEKLISSLKEIAHI